MTITMNQKKPTKKEAAASEAASAGARAMVAARWAKTTPEERVDFAKYIASQGAGRPRTGAERCKCGVMTLKLARTRADKYGKGLGHKRGCTFYRAIPHLFRDKKEKG